jgi:hypothetical protein
MAEEIGGGRNPSSQISGYMRCTLILVTRTLFTQELRREFLKVQTTARVSIRWTLSLIAPSFGELRSIPPIAISSMPARNHRLFIVLMMGEGVGKKRPVSSVRSFRKRDNGLKSIE